MFNSSKGFLVDNTFYCFKYIILYRCSLKFINNNKLPSEHLEYESMSILSRRELLLLEFSFFIPKTSVFLLLMILFANDFTETKFKVISKKQIPGVSNFKFVDGVIL